jgi:putative phosphoribosyl transferase
MKNRLPQNVVDIPELRDEIYTFADRADAGSTLANMLERYKNTNAFVLAVPAGGVPVGAVIAQDLSLTLDVLVVSKITLPWNTEAGYGAVAFDGTVRLNQRLLPGLGLSEDEIQQGIEETKNKVTRRFTDLRGNKPLPDLSKQPIIVVDDGLASGFTLLAGVEALRKSGASKIVVAVPTGHRNSVQMMADRVEAVYCGNIRHGWSFAVADAYRSWSDVTDEQVVGILRQFEGKR